jgi:hypothetical protein
MGLEEVGSRFRDGEFVETDQAREQTGRKPFDKMERGENLLGGLEHGTCRLRWRWVD